MKHPYLSVIVPARNEENLLPGCLSSLRKQKTDYPYEIIVIDSNSTDKTAEIARKAGVRYLNEKRRGKIFGFIRGAAAARGSILCFTEADCTVPPTWLESIATYFDAHPDVSGISGWYTFRGATPHEDRLTRLSLRISHILSMLVYGNATIRCSNSAVRKSAFDAIGGFDERFYELYDTDLGKRLRSQGRIRHVDTMNNQTSDRRVRGRFLRYMAELIPTAIQVVLLGLPLKNHTYKDIR